MDMIRQELEQIAYDMISNSMKHNGNDAEIWQEIQRTDSETLFNYIMEQ